MIVYEVLCRRACGLAAALVFALAGGPAWGHGARVADIPDDFAARPPIEGAAAFAGTLEAEGAYLLDAQGATLLRRINEQMRQAWATQQDPESEAVLEEAKRLQSFAEQELLALVEGLDTAAAVDVGDGTGGESYEAPYAALPGRSGAVVMRIARGDGPTRFARTPIAMDDFGEFLAQVDVATAPGVTWMLFTVTHAPVGPAMQPLDFRDPEAEPDGPPLATGVLKVRGAEMGRLRLTVRDEDGVTPCLVRLTHVATGRWVTPASAHDYTAQMDRPGLPSYDRHLAHNVMAPGPGGGLYWTVPGELDMALAAGEWQLDVRHGIEYPHHRETIAVEAGETLEHAVALERGLDMAARGWYAGDDHVHSRILSPEDAERLLDWCEAEGIHVANILRMGDHWRTHFEQRGFGPAWRARRGDHVLVPGQEDPRHAMGHAIGLNLRRMVRDLDRYCLNDWVADGIRADGGLYGFAHVGQPLFQIERDMTMLIPRGKADFAEILQFNQLGTALYYDFLDLGFRLTASAGSDVPYGASLGDVRVYACVGDAPFSADAWFDAMRAGHTFVTHGPMVSLTVDGALPGATVRVDADRTVRIEARAWGLPGTSAPRRLRVVRHGAVVEEAASDDPQQRELAVSMELRAGFGAWIAAEAVAHDGTRAHTTPVYVVRDGFRFWNVDRVADLIAARRATLDGIERMVEDARQSVRAQGLDALAGFNRPLYLQAAAILERVELVRGLFNDLEAALADELERRQPTPAR